MREIRPVDLCPTLRRAGPAVKRSHAPTTYLRTNAVKPPKRPLGAKEPQKHVSLASTEHVESNLVLLPRVAGHGTGKRRATIPPSAAGGGPRIAISRDPNPEAPFDADPCVARDTSGSRSDPAVRESGGVEGAGLGRHATGDSVESEGTGHPSSEKGPPAMTERLPDSSEKEIIDAQVEGFEVPTILLPDDREDTPSEKKIEVILVLKKLKQGLTYLGWKPIAELQSLDDLMHIYGSGTYMLQGRAMDMRHNIRQRVVSVGAEEDSQSGGRPALPPPRYEVDIAKIVATVVTALTPILGLFQQADERRRSEAREVREREADRDRETREREREARERELAMLTQTLSSRNVELSELLKGLLAQSGATTGGASDAKAYRTGQEDALALLATLKETDMLGDGTETKILDLMQSFIVGGKQAQLPPAPTGTPAAPAAPPL